MRGHITWFNIDWISHALLYSIVYIGFLESTVARNMPSKKEMHQTETDHRMKKNKLMQLHVRKKDQKKKWKVKQRQRDAKRIRWIRERVKGRARLKSKGKAGVKRTSNRGWWRWSRISKSVFLEPNGSVGWKKWVCWGIYASIRGVWCLNPVICASVYWTFRTREPPALKHEPTTTQF